MTWTARDCLTQLHLLGVRLSVGLDDNLIVDAPASLEMTDAMLSVIRKYKPGLLKILKQARCHTAETDDSVL